MQISIKKTRSQERVFSCFATYRFTPYASVSIENTLKNMTDFTRKNSDIFGQTGVKKGAKNGVKIKKFKKFLR